MSTTYSMTGTGSNPEELKKAYKLESDLAEQDMPIPLALKAKIERLEKDDVLFRISTSNRPKEQEGIITDDYGATVDLSKFPGVKFVRFSYS